MTVQELIDILQTMPKDIRVELGLDEEGQTGEGLVVSLEKSQTGNYVFIGDY